MSGVDLIGKVATCQAGKVGVIEAQRKLPWGTLYSGRRLDGHGRWQSLNPDVVADSVESWEANR